MFKKANFLAPIMLLCLAAVGSHAQVGSNDPTAEASQLTTAIAKAMQSATFENGKLSSIKLTLPNDRERLLRFNFSDDGRSFEMFDGKLKIAVSLNEYGRVSEIVFPNGKKAVYEWLMMPTGYWVPSGIKVDGKDICQRNANNIIDDGSCYDICRNAAAASAMAIGVCLASGPSVACWNATAVAAYATYLCYRCNNPQIEWPPDN